MYRRFFMMILAVLIPWTTLAAEQEPLLKDNLDKINYSLGHQLGAELLEKQVEFRPNAILQGLYDASFAADPQLPPEEMADLITQFLNGELSTLPQGFRLKGQEFLAKNYQEKDVTTLASGLQYKIIKNGAGKKPSRSDTVLVNYRARTIEGQEFDNTYPLGIATPMELQVGKLLPGLTEALQLMQEGDKWELFLPASLAYKDSGPMAGQTVIYDLELLEVLPKYR